jgi:cytochrome c2
MRLSTRWGIVSVSLLGLLALAGTGWTLKERREHDLHVRVAALTGGDPERGRALFEGYGCGGCHQLSGIAQARGRVGPPLDGVGSRAIIGGHLANSPDTLEHWIRDPQGVSPGTAMPNLNVSEQDARDLAALLYVHG